VYQYHVTTDSFYISPDGMTLKPKPVMLRTMPGPVVPPDTRLPIGWYSTPPKAQQSTTKPLVPGPLTIYIYTWLVAIENIIITLRPTPPFLRLT
jgi:hypothetical protein